jgi:tetratricopeptide (TPR) repeat protein
MTVKTIKRLAILIGIVVLVGVVAVVGQQLQLQKMAGAVLAKAKLAEKEGRSSDAEELLRQHLEVFPGDADVMVQYADLIQSDTTPGRQSEALAIYFDVVKRYPGREDVRRKLVKLEVATGHFQDARVHLEVLLNAIPEDNATPDDGDLEFLMGRCCEEEKNAKDAVQYYAKAIKDLKAIKDHAPQRIEAYSRCASLLRERLEKTDEAEKRIAEMVNSDPENYKVYLERGRYRDRFHLPGARADFEKAAKLARGTPGEPDVTLGLAKVVEQESGRAAARLILDEACRIRRLRLQHWSFAPGWLRSWPSLEIR